MKGDDLSRIARNLRQLRQPANIPVAIRRAAQLKLARSTEGREDEAVRWFGRDYRRATLLYVAHRFDYGDPHRGLSFEESAFLDSLLQFDVNVVAVDLGAARRLGRERFNGLLLETTQWASPLAAFLVLFRNEVEPVTLDMIRDDGVVVINWFADDHWRYETFARRFSPHIDIAVTTSERAADRYRDDQLVRVVKSQWACNGRLFRPSHGPKQYDVGFVGQAYGSRAADIARLRRDGIDVQAWGLGWPRGRLTMRGLVSAISRSRVFLNFAGSLAGGEKQVKARDFEVPGCGTVLATDSGPELSMYYEAGREVIAFDGYVDLRRTLKDLLENEETLRSVAAAGLVRTQAEHTYLRRFRDIFDAAGVPVAAPN